MKKSPAVEAMQENLRELCKKPPPPLPKTPAASSSSSSHAKMPAASSTSSLSIRQQRQQKWSQQIGEEDMLKALKCLLGNIRSKNAKQEAKVDGEYNVSKFWIINLDKSKIQQL